MKTSILILFLILHVTSIGQIIDPFPITWTEDKDGPKFSSSETEIPSEDISRFQLYNLTALGTTENVSSLQGNNTFMLKVIITPLQFNPSTNKQSSIGFDVNLAANAYNLKPTGIPLDSLDFSSLMFSEGGNSAFTINPAFHWLIRSSNDKKHIHRAGSGFTFSVRTVRLSDVEIKDSANSEPLRTEDIQFAIYNLNIELAKYEFRLLQDKTKYFGTSVYLNFFNVPNEDAREFNKMFPITEPFFTSRTFSSIWGLGFKVCAGFEKTRVFADFRYNLRSRGVDYTKINNPFDGSMYNIGIVQNIELK